VNVADEDPMTVEERLREELTALAALLGLIPTPGWQISGGGATGGRRRCGTRAVRHLCRGATSPPERYFPRRETSRFRAAVRSA
jgi:hypothetical protein